MALSDARKRANAKYSAAHIDQLRFDAPRGYKERVRAAAAAAGVSPSQYMRDAVAARMAADGVSYCETDNADGEAETAVEDRWCFVSWNSG